MTASNGDPRALVDTNVVVYAYDSTDLVKHETAKNLLKRLSGAGALVLSAQTLNEFSSVMMRPKRKPPMPPDQVALTLQRLAATATIVPVTSPMTFRALDAVSRHGLSFWDALIWAAAKENGVPVLYTEDFQAGRDLDGVRFVNPFA